MARLAACLSALLLAVAAGCDKTSPLAPAQPSPARPTPTPTTGGDPGTPSNGLWSGIVALPIVPVHQALLPGGKILMWDGQGWGTDARIWDPATNASVAVEAPVNVFCGGQEQMADGRIFVAGGHVNAHVGLTAANVFDPATQSWTVLPDMSFPRWYPAVTALPDGRMLVISGETSCDGCSVTTHEIYDPATNSWTRLAASAAFSFPYYPHVHVLPDGRVLVSSTSEAPIVSQVLDLGTLTWTAIGGSAVDGGSAVMYLPGKILKAGTSTDPDTASRPSAATAYVLDTTQPSPIWRQVASMSAPRTYHFLTALPDGNVLVTGGGPTTAPTDTAHAVLQAELWSPASETWTPLASMSAPRLYHSEALLLPDGRVMVSGGGRFDGSPDEPANQFSAEFFSPPYLLRGARPAITSAPSTLHYGQPFMVQTPDAARIAKVSLIRFGAVTHAIDMGQRFVPLAFAAGSGSLTVTAPANANLAPPGNYMLFLVDATGVPSLAATVHF